MKIADFISFILIGICFFPFHQLDSLNIHAKDLFLTQHSQFGVCRPATLQTASREA